MEIVTSRCPPNQSDFAERDKESAIPNLRGMKSHLAYASVVNRATSSAETWWVFYERADVIQSDAFESYWMNTAATVCI